jgi:hypothetical protein
VFEDAINFL